MFHMRSHFRHVEHYFNHTIEGFMKPMIFMLLGAMVRPEELLAVAPIGILSGLLFMFILRPLTVLISMLPFCIGKRSFCAGELAFLCFVRETGVIPAVLLITIRLTGMPGGDLVMAIGLWVILMTLIIEPPLTPYMAKKLAIAKDQLVLPERRHHGAVAVLCSRGYSFPERMKTVVDWAQQHSVENIVLLHCPEERYSVEFVKDIRHRAEKIFRDINRTRENESLKDINFEFLCGPGLLQDNIEKLIAEGDVSIIFVGVKMLDYRMEDVKRLSVPFFFMP
jgi:NhaP-type Na+/H+ or K+/H+ antiporter